MERRKASFYGRPDFFVGNQPAPFFSGEGPQRTRCGQDDFVVLLIFQAGGCGRFC